MTCKGCGEERKIEDFPFYPNSELRNKVCKKCSADRVKACKTEKRLRDQELQLKNMKIILRDIIEACEANNGRRLRLHIEKAKVEIKGAFAGKDGRR